MQNTGTGRHGNFPEACTHWFSGYSFIRMTSHAHLDARKTAENKTITNPDSGQGYLVGGDSSESWEWMGAGLKCVTESLLQKTVLGTFLPAMRKVT